MVYEDVHDVEGRADSARLPLCEDEDATVNDGLEERADGASLQ